MRLWESRQAACLVAFLLLSVFVWRASASAAETPAVQSKESSAERDARMKWWRDARFGMFIHWGVYSVPAGTYKGQTFDHIGEWIMLDGKIPVAEYREYAKDFNPVKYDPERWAQLAKDAGMKYIVITSKHHDGFAMFPSDATDWDVVDATPYGKDLIGPLAKAAREEGLKFGLYYSHAQDWVHPGGAKAHGHKSHKGWDEAHNGDFDAYLDGVAVPQVREILTRYQPDILWWDTPVEMNPKRAAKLVSLLALKPGIITNDRLQRPDQPGDFGTPEQEIPDTGLDRDWETCMTMNKTWGYKSYDHNWKSAETLIRNLVEAASKGGNYLLNIGPKSDGTIPEESIERLEAIGRWMKVNGESIHGTVASPIERPKWGRITTKRGDSSTTLYLHVLDWPADGELPVALDNEVEECRLLADPKRKLTVDRDERHGLVVNLIGQRPDPICSVVRLTIAGDPAPVDPPRAAGVKR
jgi:alpha-L-fucosidase